MKTKTEEARERLIALKEGDTAHDSEKYFNARAHFDSDVKRKIFGEGHKRGWDSGHKQGVKDMQAENERLKNVGQIKADAIREATYKLRDCMENGSPKWFCRVVDLLAYADELEALKEADK